ncbi:formimidoylglutamase [Halomonas campisalis]|uniref:Formimidoylglutamase n=1 Tax=Billgrantia campisalis TaxID=74661 RepID=A0ABS9P673_9GAMM|nr:formimidoylglutamase [Halomonas campisalis]MCG6657249.1 formimidoylglutamase [Halomonas campisalis]MDR5862435.1 formimidoylglutamase [Halomonas campisalis]
MTKPIDMSPWAGREDPEADSLRWHQVVEPLPQAPATPGVALVGFACDAGVARNQGRVGAAKGPRALRKALAPLAWHRLGPAYDAGDIACHGDSDMEAAQGRLAERVDALLAKSLLPIVLGGGHEVAFGSWSGLARHLEAGDGPAPRVGIINFDAHFDLRDPAHVRSSGTPFAQIAEGCESRGWPFHYACLGVSRAANTRALFNRAQELGVLVREDHEITPARLAAVGSELDAFIGRCDLIYLTLDLDVLPAAEAPGVSAPAAHGVPLALLEPLLSRVRDSGKLALVDLAELNPDFDIDGHTAKAAARLIHHLTLNS